ncbi:Alpha/beta hydrolase family protein [Posidoniimonas polymericola]|uniref:Alpha/beta hydrolase family protein n=1 Tax=Posidoniimonas polymericola TaxID=2528002 RepID=A0A5C5XUA0_9BACT|nr:alpha/beta hydrolase-fold protein [Posidoniimonas polymericola]TWT66876.1 Alpha/beta hydrolase family protein [Posidoniimonas polymericola]
MTNPIWAARLLLLAAVVCHAGASVCPARTWQDSVARTIPGVPELGADGAPIGYLEEPMGYRYFLPQDYDPSQEYPLVLFLHGSGESGTNNTSHVSIHIENLIEQTYANYPAILVAPQLNRSVGFSPYSSVDRTDEVLDAVISELPVDEQRLYITGLSMGGFGTMNYLHYYNGYQLGGDRRFAAAAAIAGSTVDFAVADALSETPIWLVHGSSDPVVSVSYSRESFNTLIGAEPDATIDFTGGGRTGRFAESGSTRYLEYPGVTHNSWSRFYGSNDFYDWMFSQSLVPEPTSLASGVLGLVLLGSTSRRRCQNSVVD